MFIVEFDPTLNKDYLIYLILSYLVINSQTSAIALGASADGLLVPTAVVKAMPVFRNFDYGHSVECAMGKKGDPSTSCIIVVYPRDK